MKPLNKEDMPKLIVLIVLAVGIFGFALVQFISSSSPSVAATPAAPGSTPGAGTTVTSAAGPGSAAQDVPVEPELDFLHIGPPMGGKDPFIPNGSASVDPTATVAAATVVRALPPVALSSSKPVDFGKILADIRPDGPTMTEREEKPAVDSKPMAPVVVELPAPAWNVSGIVLAERDSDGIKRGRDVAILRDTTGNRRFVTVGDPVDNGYRVSAVQPGGVEIRNKNRTAMIHLDSSTPNSSQSPDGTTTGSRGINGATTRAN
jgi:hypothetical protein